MRATKRLVTMMRLTQIGLIVAGIALLALAAWLHSGNLRFLGDSQVADGIVVALPDGPLHSTIRFIDSSGRAVEYHENGNHDPVAVGQHLRIRYLSADPQGSARLDAAPGTYGAERSVTILAAVLIVTGLLLPWLSTRFPGIIGVRGRR